ncbi:hypothetical protein FVE85_9683 [Porphyridium purpureum]|uniref:SET domain-containing protein n=1 Tax=Porphyridium purpureum TaxID=35688 RepID=A0A5J4YJP3_PORPP|nr:hypothetical protein FVE85_9683 [Porphyridium purpureum]|eukprot:POR8867..scf246_12
MKLSGALQSTRVWLSQAPHAGASCLLLLLSGLVWIPVLLFVASLSSSRGSVVQAQREVVLSSRSVSGILGIPIVPTTRAVSRAEAVGEFQEWFLANGGRMHPNISLVAMDADNANFGYVATGSITKGDALVEAPEHLVLSSRGALAEIVADLHRLDRAERNSAARKISVRQFVRVMGYDEDADEDSGLTTNADAAESLDKLRKKKADRNEKAVLALFVMIHRANTARFWYPELAMLPRECTMALCWDADRVAATFSTLIRNRLRDDQKYYLRIAQALALDSREFVRTVALIKSRSWGGQRGIRMVPGLEFVNHDPVRGSQATFSSGGARFLYEQAQALRPGDQIYGSYGEKHNGLLLMQFGFVVQRNPYDTCASLLKYLNPSFIAANIQLAEGMDCSRVD